MTLDLLNEKQKLIQFSKKVSTLEWVYFLLNRYTPSITDANKAYPRESFTDTAKPISDEWIKPKKEQRMRGIVQ